MTRLRFFFAQGCLAFLPALVVLLVAREDKGRAADLSVLFGLIGATFSTSYFGQRAYIAIRGFGAIDARAAISFRLVLTLLAGGTTLAVAGGMHLGLGVALFAVAMKLSEGVVDLWVGMRIRTSSEAASSAAFVAVALGRTLLIGAPIVIVGARASTESGSMAGYLALLAAVAYLLVHRDTRRMGLGGSYRVGPRALLAHGWELRTFMAATAACAILSSTPRLVLPYTEPQTYVAAALALSIVPAYGLICQALWLTHLKGLTEQYGRSAPRFVGELILVTGGVAAAVPVWKLLAEHLYGLEEASDQAAFAATGIAGVVLFGAIGMSNLFKLTRRPRNEGLNYALGGGCILVATLVLGAPVATALLAAAALMLVFVALGCRRGVQAGG